MNKERSSGILLHITSLPGPYGVGDLGPEAYRFADQLVDAGQRYWLVLPVNPVQGSHFSPYSCLSSMAGNVLLISPDLLVTEGLLTEKEVASFRTGSHKKVDYAKAVEIKKTLLNIAYESFVYNTDHPYHKIFEKYCETQAEWLDDYAAYRVLHHRYDGKPWQQWDKKFGDLNEEELQKEKWWQFVFDEQWKALKTYCNRAGVLLFGDMPIYVHPSSVDVWTHTDLFEVDEKGYMTGMAGVPPDYFNDQGQLWSMPLYKWDVLKEKKYDWWIKRIKRNLEWFDIIRLDHFRAFSAYWRVEAGESSAINGKWLPGPSNDFFDALRSAFPDLPFVAEDLGIIDDPVRNLRDDYNIPGMCILQFAFGNDMADSEYIPHRLTPHAVLFTGTHDNNTTRGWYKESDRTTRKNLRRYTGQRVTSREAPFVLSRMAYASVCNTVILPIQDVIGLPGSDRMNNPASGEGSWKWRMLPGEFTPEMIKRLKKWGKYYGRTPDSVTNNLK